MVRNFTSVTKIYEDDANTVLACYKAIENNIEYFVPHDADNTDYQDILAWVADGNSITDPANGD